MFWRDTINLSYLAKWIEETKNSTCKFMSGIIFALEVEKWLLNKWIRKRIISSLSILFITKDLCGEFFSTQKICRQLMVFQCVNVKRLFHEFHMMNYLDECRIPMICFQRQKSRRIMSFISSESRICEKNVLFIKISSEFNWFCTEDFMSVK